MGRPMKRLQTNFSSGEVDPLLRMRSDTGAFPNAAKKLRNMRMLNTGGVERRPGLEYKATLPGNSRLVHFEFSSSSRYVLAFSNTRLDVYNTSGTLLTSVTGCVWTTSELFSLTFSQSGSVMIVCHEAFKPQVITRTGASTFTVAAFAFTNAVNGKEIYQPYAKIASDEVMLKVSATTGSGVTVTASASVFLSSHVGSTVRWFGKEIEITAYTSGTVVTGTIRDELKGTYDLDPIRTTDGSTTVEMTHALHGLTTGDTLTIAGLNGVGGISKNAINGTFTITVTDDNHYTYNTGASASSSEDGGGSSGTFTGSNIYTRRWDEAVFATPNGWPRAVTFHEGRLWFGGTTEIPDGIWASKVGQFYNFNLGDGNDDESIQVTIGSDDISAVRHIVSNRDLQIFTATSEFYVQRNALAPITPSSIRIIRQTPFGCSEITPYPLDGATIFVQDSGKSIREFLYGDAENAYNSVDLTLIASHLINDPTDMNVSYGSSDHAEQYAYVVNGDGTMAVFLSARAEKIAGWTLWSLAGTDDFMSVTSVGGETFFAVKRSSTYTLERLSTDDNITLDRAVTLTGTSSATWTVSTYFSNGAVIAAIDTSNANSPQYLGTFTVASGQITLPRSVTSVQIGYAFDIEIETMPVDIQLADGPWTAQWKRIASVTLFLDRTFNARVGNNVLDITTSGGNSTEKVFYLLGYSRQPTLRVIQTQPEPFRLLAIAMEVGI